MNDFLPTSIVELQNTLSLKNIDRLKKNFIKRNFFEEDPPVDIDYGKGILYHYDSIKNDLVGKEFEAELKEILWNVTNKIKVEIDLSRIKLNDNERTLFWDEILSSIDKLRETSKQLISLFPLINRGFNEIDNYLLVKYSYQTEDFFDDGYFNLDGSYKKDDLIKVFRFLTKNDYINGVKYSERDFLSVFLTSITETTIEFNCFTYVMVCILENISNLFVDMTPKKIGESKRFKTKPSKNKYSEVLTADNYGRAKNSIKEKENNKHLLKVTAFFETNFPK